MYDALIIGARCAGSPLAMLLARRGARVLVLDRGTFPSNIPHGHFVHRHGPRRLREWGLLSDVAARTPAVTSALVDFGDFPLLIREIVEDGLPWAYGPRRSTLDKILVDAAAGSGADVREGFHVDEYIVDGDAVVGVRGRGADGRKVEERATITIGADGRNSHLARFVSAQAYNEVPPIRCCYFSYWQEVERGVGDRLCGQHRGGALRAVPATGPRDTSGRERQTRGGDAPLEGSRWHDRAGPVLQPTEPGTTARG